MVLDALYWGRKQQKAKSNNKKQQQKAKSNNKKQQQQLARYRNGCCDRIGSLCTIVCDIRIFAIRYDTTLRIVAFKNHDNHKKIIAMIKSSLGVPELIGRIEIEVAKLISMKS